MASTMYGFEAKRKHKTPKDGKLNGLHNGHLRFSKLLVFDPQKWELPFFSKLKSYKINFLHISNNGIHKTKLYSYNQFT